MSEKLATIESSTKPEQDSILEVVAELEKPIKKIIEKILPRIENGEYGLIIGDDASGRIPAIILGNFIKKVSELRGLPKPNTIFIPGKLKEEMIEFYKKQGQELNDYIHKSGMTDDKKVLIVTDTILSGGTLQTLVGLLHKSGHVCDIATIGLEEPSDLDGEEYRADALGGSEIISGEYDGGIDQRYPHTPQIYEQENKEYSGVYKTQGEPTSRPLKSKIGITDSWFRPRKAEEIQSKINQSRKDANIVTQHLIEWYKSQNSK